MKDRRYSDMTAANPMNSVIAHGSSPPWLPREVSEGRRFAWWGQIMFLLMAFIWFVIGIASIVLYAVDGRTGSLVFGLFGFIAMVICFMSAVFVKKTVLDAIDQGRFHDAKNDSVFWIVMGIFGFALPSVMLAFTHLKVSDALTTQAPPGYMPYAPGSVVTQAPPPGQQPAPVPPPPQPAHPQAAQQHAPAGQYHAHQTPMHRCKNCNVQFPAFMHACPNCGAPKA
jgi:hypothetical protein